jgi:redox-sensing transcriptional repressor
MADTSPRNSVSIIPTNTIARLSLYRRLLLELASGGTAQVYSHQLAALAVSTSAQVRRDLMTIGFSGSPRRGYAIQDLMAAINVVMARSVETSVALVGVGNLGRALLSYYATRQPWVRFTAAFDRDTDKTGRIIHGCRVYPMDQLETVLQREAIRAVVIAVPTPEAQSVADRLVLAGIRSFLNFAPVRLHVPTGTFVDNFDMSTALDRVAYYAHAHGDAQTSLPASGDYSPLDPNHDRA